VSKLIVGSGLSFLNILKLISMRLYDDLKKLFLYSHDKAEKYAETNPNWFA
jgi:hypothetical protein